jgi:hypothetical protein
MFGCSQPVVPSARERQYETDGQLINHPQRLHLHLHRDYRDLEAFETLGWFVYCDLRQF